MKLAIKSVIISAIILSLFGLNHYSQELKQNTPRAFLVEIQVENPVQLPPCSTEDSDNCFWDAKTAGNGIGESFSVQNGIVTYQ